MEFKDLPEPMGTWCILKNEQNMIEEHTDSKTQDNTSTETITQDHSGENNG